MVAPVQVQFKIKREAFETDTSGEDKEAKNQNQW
jgi:hypothetical protein